ncbi:TVP38/TMEM64 family protein [Sinorhizobium terangae]|uniref:TVP38/TMEM64 family protein n=1 Tax=Sinorhizobium terangae TaxID=110322 RepID=UPI0024B03E43|nr:TVP38/TMEM64 family protein [Sinorhizobium terangae]WFU47931.1 TVP38/TMEM64 family protein [Sinorhizobium terangae]
MNNGVRNGAEGAALNPSSGRSDAEHAPRRSPWRFVPFALLLLGGAVCYAFGLPQYLSLTALVHHREILSAYVDTHPLHAGTAFFAVYVAVVVFSIPAASVLTIFSGFLFGCVTGGIIAIAAATLGSCLLFLAARGVLGDLLRPRAGRFLERLAEGFRRNAFLYLLVLRLAPIFPFFVVNIAPAFFDVRLRTFALATLIGIVPGTLAYAWLGRSLDAVIARSGATGGELTLADFATRDISLGLAALTLIAALPLALKLIQSRRKAV